MGCGSISERKVKVFGWEHYLNFDVVDRLPSLLILNMMLFLCSLFN